MFNPLSIFFSIAAPVLPEPVIEIEIRPEAGMIVINTISGETGIVRSVWTNQWTNQDVVNVRCNGMMASWNMLDVAVQS